jgi:D-psicose/D-tagatose/L-ribulose 3-epimerase
MSQDKLPKAYSQRFEGCSKVLAFDGKVLMSNAAPRNPLGVHALVWVGGWSEPEARAAIAASRRAGYDLIEIPLLDPWSVDVKMTRRLLEEHDLAMTASLGLSPATDVSSEDPEVVAAGERLLRQAADVVRDLGGDYLCGVLYCSLGKYAGPATERGRANAVEAIQRLADHAAASGISLGIEVVNRYESNLINTARQALAFIDDVDRTGVYVHLDTYHMHIEEPDMASPVLLAGDRLGYVHVGESHRGYLGSGSVDYGTFFRALAQIGYGGPITFESFSSAVVSPLLSNTLAIWRDLWTDSADLAGHARSFIEGHIRAVASIGHH